MTRCDSCARPALIRQNDAHYCEVCYCIELRESQQRIADTNPYRSREWVRAKRKIDKLNSLISELWRDCRKRKKAA